MVVRENGCVTVKLAEVVSASHDVGRTGARSAKIARLARCLRGAHADDLPIAVSFLIGAPRQRQLGVGWAALREGFPAPADSSELAIAEVDRAFEAISVSEGAGSQAERRQLLAALLSRATGPEQEFLAKLVGGELRQGAQAGLMMEAVATAFDVSIDLVRRAVMLSGDLGATAVIAATKGAVGLAAVGLEVGRPVQPMLAGTAEDVASALDRVGEAAVEWKLDGIRVQIHRDGDSVAIYTRTLDDITERLPEIAAAARALPVARAVLDGEVIALDVTGRPRRFQETASRVGRRGADAGAAGLSLFLFDALHLDGDDLIDRPGGERSDLLASVAPAGLRVPRLVAPTTDAARAFTAEALARGHEGVMVKSLEATYDAGRRGVGWLKVKPVHVLDFVILAAEWGHGRRQGRLSNLHLGVRDPRSGAFAMVGKTFKGLTDAMLAWQTAHLLERETGRDGIVVYVRPELVVEVAFDGVQTSRRYPAGMALRFARVRRHRPDKSAAEADTVDALRAIHGG